MAPGDPYITLAQLKDALGVTDSEEDAILDRALKGATKAIEKRAGNRSFWVTATAETRNLSSRGRIRPIRTPGQPLQWLFLTPDIANDTDLAVNGWSAVTYDTPAPGEPITALYAPSSYAVSTLTVTAHWGWPEVPDDIIWACQTQAMRYYRRKGSPEGIAGSSEWGLVSVPRLDPDVRSIIDAGYRLPGIG